MDPTGSIGLRFQDRECLSRVSCVSTRPSDAAVRSVRTPMLSKPIIGPLSNSLAPAASIAFIAAQVALGINSSRTGRSL